MQIFTFADRKGHLDRIDLRNRREQRSSADQVPDLGLGDSGYAVDWRPDLAPLEVEPGVFDRSRGLLHGSRTGQRGLIDVIEVLLAYHVLLKQRLVAREVLLVFLVVGLCLRE